KDLTTPVLIWVSSSCRLAGRGESPGVIRPGRARATQPAGRHFSRDQSSKKNGPNFLPMKNLFRNVVHDLAREWKSLKDWVVLLRPCWVPLTVLGIAFISALALNQAPEILRRLIEGAATRSTNERYHWLIAMIAIWLWATANWYGSRLLFDEAV